MAKRHFRVPLALLGLGAGAVALAGFWSSPGRAAVAAGPGGHVPVDGYLNEMVIDAAGERAYITNPARNRVEVLVLATKTLESPIEVGSQPLGLDFSVDGRLLYVANSGADYVSVVDVGARREVRRIDIPGGYFESETPYSVAVAANGQALVTTTFPGSGWTPLYQVDLATGAVRARPDFRVNGTTTESTRLEASGDRSRIGIVGGNNSGGPVDIYTVATDSFTESKDLSGYLSAIALDRTGEVVLANHYLMDRDLVLRATLTTGRTRGLAVDAAGTTAYRVRDDDVVVEDLGRGLVAGTIGLPAPANDSAGRIALTPDGTTLVVGTNTGVAVVPTSAMVAEPACDTSGSTASLAKVCGAPVADIVVDPSGARAYATNRQRNQVEVFSLATRRLETPIPVGSRPQGLDLSADGRLLYVANSGANDVSVVDLALGREVRRITVPTTWLNERPHSIAVAANGTALMTTTFEGSGNSAMWLIDLGDETLRPPPPIRTYDTEVGARSRVEPSADRSHILLVETDSSAGEVFLLDTSAGTWDQKTLARFVTFGALDATGSTVLVGPGTFVLDGDLVLRSTVPGGGAGVASNRAGTVGYRVQDGYVEVLDLARGTVTATLELPEDLGTSRGVVALTPDDATLLVATATGVSAVPVSAADPLPVCTSTLADICGAGLDEVVVDPAGRRAYVSNPLLNQVEVISLTTRQLEAPIPVGSLPLGMDFSADGRLLYVANSGATDVSVVDLALRREVRRIPVPSGWLNERPRSIAVAANGRAFLTTDYGGSGWTDLLEIDLDDETVSVRSVDRGDPSGGNSTVTSETDLYASGDRSRVALVQNDNSSGPVTVYDAASDSFAPLRRLANFTGPSALDRTGSTLLVDGWVLDRDLVQRATIGPFRGTGVALSPDGAHGYRAAEEAVEVLDIRRGLVVGSIPVPERPAAGHRGLTVTPDGATLLVLTERGVAIAPVSSAVALPACTPETVAGSVVKVCGDLFWAAGSRVGEIVVDAAGARAYATNPSRNQVEVVSLATRTLEAPIAVGSQPMGLDFSADGRTLYVANSGGNDLSVVDLASRREVRRIVVPPGEFNHRPQSIVVAGNGTALVLTTFDGSGWSHLRQVDLAAGTVRVRTDLREFGIAAGDVADFAATADRSRIAMVSRDGTYLYDVARDSLVGATSPESCRRFVDVDASGATVLASRCILEGDGRHRATIEGFGRGVAITSAGDRGYRVLGNSVQGVDLATGATSSGEALPDTVHGQQGGQMAITPDGRTLLVQTELGMAFVGTDSVGPIPTSTTTTPTTTVPGSSTTSTSSSTTTTSSTSTTSTTAPPGVALQSPYTVWTQPGPAGLDGLGTWFATANDPAAKAGQAPARYLYALGFGFTGSTASGTIGLVTVPEGKFALLTVRGPDGKSYDAAIPFDWEDGRFYFPLVHQLAPGVWGGWVFDHSGGTWVPIGQVSLPAAWGKLSPSSYTASLWLGAPAATCSAYPAADVLVHPPIGFSGSTTSQGQRGFSGAPAGACAGQASVEHDLWARYRSGS